MIRVAHFTYLLNVSGASNSLLMHCKLHDRSQFQYAVVALDGGERVETIREVGVPVYTGYDSLYAVMQWADIINMNLGNFDGPLLIALQQLGKPFVITLRWASPLPPLPTLVVCTAKHTYDIQPDKSRSIFIRNGIDLEKFTPQPKINNKDEVIITRVCRPARCSLYFWTAIQKVLKKYPQAKLWVVGNADGLGKDTEQIKFLGVRRDIPDILAQSDIFAYTPYPNEGSMDLAVLEALAMGVPCVAADTNAVRESIIDGETGFLVPFGDEAAFAAQLGKLVEDAELRSQMRQNALQQKSRSSLDIQWTIAQYEAVYKGMLAAHGQEFSFTPETNPELAALSTKAYDITADIIAEKEAFKREVTEATRQIMADHGATNGTPSPSTGSAILPTMAETASADTADPYDLAAMQLLQRLTGESTTALNAQLARLDTSSCMRQALLRETVKYKQRLGISNL